MLCAASATSGSSTIAAFGTATSASGPRTTGRGSTRRRTLSSGPEGGITSFNAARIADCWTLSRTLRPSLPLRWSATAPNPQAMNSPSPTRTTAPPKPSSAPERAPCPRRDQRVRDSVEGDREEGADQDPGRDGDERRVLGLRAAVEQLGPDPGAERRPADEPGERQGAGDQAALVSDRREGEHEDGDPDVDQVHPPGDESDYLFPDVARSSHLAPAGCGPMSRISPEAQRRRRILTRTAPIALGARARRVRRRRRRRRGPRRAGGGALPRRLGGGRLRGDASRDHPRGAGGVHARGVPPGLRGRDRDGDDHLRADRRAGRGRRRRELGRQRRDADLRRR